jgi:hypothetical protein
VASRTKPPPAITDPHDPYAEVKRRLHNGEFPGFGPPETNWHRTPNGMTDIRARIIRDPGDKARGIEPGTAAATVVLDYILRHTWGYQEFGEAKRITIEEFIEGRRTANGTRMDAGAGPSRATIIKALTYLEQRGYLDVERDDHDLGRRKKMYKLRMAPGAVPQPF